MDQRQPYSERFPVGVSVRVAPLSELERFASEWKWHHPLQAEQLRYAGAAAKVREVGFYHGGDVLYQLEGLPGTWHEQCLLPA
jgi:diadenosine tetraphosphatase ApaH/serine/threonine PP2A family protein phosphatase